MQFLLWFWRFSRLVEWLDVRLAAERVRSPTLLIVPVPVKAEEPLVVKSESAVIDPEALRLLKTSINRSVIRNTLASVIL